MADLSNAKTLGGVGSILVLLTAAPSIGWLLGIVGFIMILVAVRDISEMVSDRSIFNNMLIATGLAIAGIVVGGLVVVGSLFAFVLGPNFSTFQSIGPNFNPATVPTGDWVALLGGLLAGLAVVWVMLLISAVFVRRAYGEIATKLNVGTFRTAGLVYLIGAATTIVLVGFVLLLVSQILLVVAFFSIQERTPVVVGQPAQPLPISQ